MKFKTNQMKDKNQGKSTPNKKSIISPLNDITTFWKKMENYWWDFIGVFLICISLLTLMGLLNITRGVLITPWALFISRWLGWGAYFAIGLVGLLGYLSIRKEQLNDSTHWFKKILAYEGLLFTLLAFFALNSGRSLQRAEAGLDGGLIGWGLSGLLDIIFPTFLSYFVLIGLLLIFLVVGFDLSPIWKKLYNKLIKGIKIKIPYHNQIKKGFSIFINTNNSNDDPITERIHEKINNINNQDKEEELNVPFISQSEVILPPINLLMNEHAAKASEENIHSTASIIERTLNEFGIPSRVVGFRIGPTVTQFAVEPGYVEKVDTDGKIIRQKIRVSQISNLSRDIALSLSAGRLRIEAPVPGHSFVGIEVPNLTSTLVRLRPIIESEEFEKVNSPITIALGKNVAGQPVVADLGSMPHLLIAGTTGSGKSICIQSIITCLVMRNSPNDLRLAILDPKMVELFRFNDLPHLVGKVETEPERMLAVLRWGLKEMDLRYRLLEDSKSRDIESYNSKMRRKGMPTLTRIVIIIDELADLMMSMPDQTEKSLVRLAQMARATGIHLIVATQRPSTDIVTGLIKANFPARISFSVASSIDSRVILDTNGAESLLGKGDMLFLQPDSSNLMRTQGVMVTEQEIDRIISFWQRNAPDSDGRIPWDEFIDVNIPDQDELIEQAITIVRQAQKASASMLQRRLRIGYPRAARLIDDLEALGVVGPLQVGGREREVLVPPASNEIGDDE